MSLREKEDKEARKAGKKAKISIFVFLGVVTFTGFIAPFAHVFYNNSGIPGIFGFDHMSGFLYAIGFPILSIASGTLFHFVARKLAGVLSRAFTIIAFLFNYVGIFFLTWAFMPVAQDFAPVYYYLSMIGMAFAVTVILHLISRYILTVVGKVDLLIGLVDTLRSKYFLPMASEAANEDNIDKIRADVDKFDDEIFETLEELTK